MMDFLASLPLTTDDLITAAFIAVVVVVAIRLLGWAFRMVINHTGEIEFDPSKADEVRKRCSVLFPIENLNFDGATFTRGNIVRIITHRQDAMEGEFVGTNRNNMLCIVADNSIIAQELRAIETIQVIGRAAG